MDIETAVELHLEAYRKGTQLCPRTANACKVKPAYTAAYIAEWDKQCLAARAKMFAKGVK